MRDKGKKPYAAPSADVVRVCSEPILAGVSPGGWTIDPDNPDRSGDAGGAVSNKCKPDILDSMGDE